MKKHIRVITSMTLVAGLSAGCAGGEPIDGGTSAGFGVDDGDLSGDETGEGTGGDEDGVPLPPDDDDDDLDPDATQRIFWIGEVDGDLVVHARLGAAVAADYPEGVMYRIRFDVSGQAMYAEIVDADEEVLDLVRVAELPPFMYPAEEARVLSFCYPFPVVPPTAYGCTFSPCPWDEKWPGQGALWPDCIEVSQASGTVRVVGAIEGMPIGQELTQGAAPVPMFESQYSPGQTQRVRTVSAIAEDLSSLAPELDALEDGSTACGVIGAFAAGRGAACGVFDDGACSDAYWAAMAYGNQC